MYPSLAFGSVARTSPGVYCVAAPLLTVGQRAAAVVSVRDVSAGYLAGTSLCTTGIEVRTRNTANAPVDNVDFNVLVP